MVRLDSSGARTRASILDAAARVLSRRPELAMADIAQEAGVGRATLYRHFPTREALLQGVAETGASELAEAIEAAQLDELPVDRAIARLTHVFVRTGVKYAALINHMEDHGDPAAKRRVLQPVHDVLARGVREGVLRTDLPGDIVFEMFSALVERALQLTIDDAVTPEAAAEAAVTMFLDGARRG